MTSLESVKKLVARRKKSADQNRMYYSRCFNITDLRKAGLVEDASKSRFDRVNLEPNMNEFIDIFGVDQSGTCFELSLSIVQLQTPAKGMNDWRLATADFVFHDAKDNSKYSYHVEELIDYASKRANQDSHEASNIYKVGFLSVETVQPFSLSRILFNGLLTKSADSKEEIVSSRVSISTHPTCDKFDYRCRFDTKYLSKSINSCGLSEAENAQLLNLVTEDRWDQGLMFELQLETFDEQAKSRNCILWGGKVKRYLNLADFKDCHSSSRESLFIWADCGHQIHLNRVLKFPGVVYGLVQNSYDYASYLYDSHLYESAGESKTQLASFSDLKSFSDLNSEIVVTGFREKNYTIEFGELNQSTGLRQVKVNGYKGWAFHQQLDLADRLTQAERKLWTVCIGERNFAPWLSSESLLGGKGNSLIELDLASRLKLSANNQELQVSVPRGIIISCSAYRLWLSSNAKIAQSILDLDGVRRALAAKSVYTNILSDKYLTLASQTQTLRDQCEKTCTTLKSCPLPEPLKAHIHVELSRIFKPEELQTGGKLFAVRSSAVGEDTLETSAAGQMKTILDAAGFESICEAIVECWSSQFEQEAVTYKSQNGVELNSPMAVVVQELIACKVAGVATTCNPLSGDKKQLQILANPGLGEGVVQGKETDTIRVDLDEHLSLAAIEVVSNQTGECCLSNAQIVALSNLLLCVRRASRIKEREVEWGITWPDSSSSSSSSDSSLDLHEFHIHLLQSRPLSNLSRLSVRELDHELDYGYSSPRDVVSRANLGEVMPGALSPLNVTFFLPLTLAARPEKPFEPHHTIAPFASNTFAFHGQLAATNLSYSDTIHKFRFNEFVDDHQKGREMETVWRLMIGSGSDFDIGAAELRKLNMEKMNPLSKVRPDSIARLFALDAGLATLIIMRLKQRARRFKLQEDLQSLDQLIDRLDSQVGKVGHQYERSKLLEDVRNDINTLWQRLCQSKSSPLIDAWIFHIKATILNMVLNMMCIKMMSNQSSYPNELDSSEILNDFSVLMRGGKTESGDISLLLDRLIKCLVDEGRLDEVRPMSNRQLFEFLERDASAGNLFRRFMAKNGHRAFKEFDLSTLSWADEPNYIIKSLAMRLKQLKSGEQSIDNNNLQRDADQQAKLELILTKIQTGKRLFTSYALPRAKAAVTRREKSKSHLMKMVDKYRKAFRHLGALLCLVGKLPSADLIFQLTISELDLLIRHEPSGKQLVDTSRLLYKARRRQQRVKVLNQVTFANPTIDFAQMVETLNEIYEQQPSAEPALANGTIASVTGLTSCAGLVTGRACVAASLEDLDRIEPGDILVTYSIDISWSVYFFTLSGIVTEVGGIVSHGAVVAREYGIPTLCTAIGACSKFKTGQMITLDANRGVCYLAEP